MFLTKSSETVLQDHISAYVYISIFIDKRTISVLKLDSFNWISIISDEKTKFFYFLAAMKLPENLDYVVD